MPSLLKYPTTTSTANGSGSGGTWSNPTRIFLDDGLYASAAYLVDGFGSKTGLANLVATGFGYTLPPNAVIDGIQVEYKVVASQRWVESGSTLKMMKAGSVVGSNKAGLGSSANGIWTYGGPTDLWGTTWTPADINNATFGFNGNYDSVSSSPADYLMQIDYVRVTVYYHITGTTSPSDVPIREIYKVRNQKGEYIGLLPQPTEELKIAQDMNSLGSQITLKVPGSTDTAVTATYPYTTEDLSANYTDETGTGDYTTEGDVPIVSAAFQSIDTLIKNGNTVECWLFNYFYPNGKCMFVGKIRRWEDDDEANAVNVTLYSTSYDLDNYYSRGAPFTYVNDQVQNSYNQIDYPFMQSGKGSGWHLDGQTFVVGAGVTNIAAITIACDRAVPVTVSLYNGLNGSLLGQVNQDSQVGGTTFGFPNLITVTPGQTLFFTVTPDPGYTLGIGYQTGNVYANGSMYVSDYSGGSGGGSWIASTGNDLWFITASGSNTTTGVFTSKDPSTGMLVPIISDYNIRGGTQQWTATSIDATGLSLSYTFSVQTIYQAMQAILEMSPAGFYYYIDIGNQIIYFKNASTTPDFLLQKGVHIQSLKLGATNEESINTLPFTGGEVTPGVNLYKLYTDTQSIAAFGPLLKPKSDNRVKLDGTANAIGQNTLAEFAGEKYFTTVTVVHTTKLDITLLTPGKVVGFRGHGNFKDQVVAQIVRREWSAGAAVLTIGVLPMRQSTQFAQMMRDLQQEQTEYNPTSPS